MAQRTARIRQMEQIHLDLCSQWERELVENTRTLSEEDKVRLKGIIDALKCAADLFRWDGVTKRRRH